MVNPNGVLFARGAEVDVGGLVASTLNLSHENFIAGHYKFDGGGTGEVRNAGTIEAHGGGVAMLGAHVTNDGTITAHGGTVALAAGDKISVNLDSPALGVTIERGALQALVANHGVIKSPGGAIELTAAGTDQLIKSAVNNDGIIEANSLTSCNGVIRLTGDDITNTGTLHTDGSDSTAGRIDVHGAHDVTLGATSLVSANGTRGGEVTVQAHGGTCSRMARSRPTVILMWAVGCNC